MNDTTLEDLHGLALELKSMIAMAPELSREPLLRKAREIEKLAEKAVEDSKVQVPEPLMVGDGKPKTMNESDFNKHVKPLKS